MRDPQAAAEHYDRAIAIRESLMKQEASADLLRDLAVCYLNKANLLAMQDDDRGALEFFDRCVQMRERLVHEFGRTELLPNLALVYCNRAGALMALEMHVLARQSCDNGVAIYRDLLKQGRADLAGELARALYNLAMTHASAEDWRRAVATLDEPIAIWGRLVTQGGQRELLGDYAQAMGHRGEFLAKMGDRRGRLELQEAIALLEAEVARNRLPLLERRLHTLRENLAELS